MQDRHSRELDGKSIIITGAGTGVGRAIAIEASRRGARVTLVGRRAHMLEETAFACRGPAMISPNDVSIPDTARRVVEDTLGRFGAVDGLVNNAALARFGALEELQDSDVRMMFEVGFLACVRFIREALQPLRAAHGCVVNVSSIGGVVATPRRAAYGAVKAALNHLTRSLARELAPEVRVNAVLPGPIATPMWEGLGIGDLAVDELLVEMKQTTPAGRLARPEEISGWVCTLLDERSSWVTGSLLTIDGGRSC